MSTEYNDVKFSVDENEDKELKNLSETIYKNVSLNDMLTDLIMRGLNSKSVSPM